MRFQILSHAGLLVECQGKQLICDPWLLGSCYWRSWWNYPPVKKELIESLKPDYIYLTHIHWDHFHAVSLKKFHKDTPIIIPKDHLERFKQDLIHSGFDNIIEISHGEKYSLTEGFDITSYQFNFVTDSGLIIEGDDTTLFNANDAKFVSGPLSQILQRHPNIDFLFRSHSSANARACFDITDDKDSNNENLGIYPNAFCNFTNKVKPKFVIPFASNCCHLHKDVYHFNDIVQTPVIIRDHFNSCREEKNLDTQLQVMVSGDTWDSKEGFAISPEDYFSQRKEKIAQYREENEHKLQSFYVKEEKTTMPLAIMERYFIPFSKNLPFPVRVLFKNKPILFILKSGEKKYCFLVDLYKKNVRPIKDNDLTSYPLQILTSTYIMRNATAKKMMSSIGLSKRVIFRADTENMKTLRLLNHIFYLYDYGMFPLSRLLRPKFIQNYLPRWREIILYMQIARDLALGRNLINLEEKYVNETKRKIRIQTYTPTKPKTQKDSVSSKPK